MMATLPRSSVRKRTNLRHPAATIAQKTAPTFMVPLQISAPHEKGCAVKNPVIPRKSARLRRQRALPQVNDYSSAALMAAIDGCPQPGCLTHDPEKACPGRDPGWIPAFGKDHAPT